MNKFTGQTLIKIALKEYWICGSILVNKIIRLKILLPTLGLTNDDRLEINTLMAIPTSQQDKNDFNV